MTENYYNLETLYTVVDEFFSTFQQLVRGSRDMHFRRLKHSEDSVRVSQQVFSNVRNYRPTYLLQLATASRTFAGGFHSTGRIYIITKTVSRAVVLLAKL